MICVAYINFLKGIQVRECCLMKLPASMSFLLHLETYLQLNTHIIKVDDHGAVAHVRGFVVGLAAGGEGHSAGARAD